MRIKAETILKLFHNVSGFCFKMCDVLKALRLFLYYCPIDKISPTVRVQPWWSRQSTNLENSNKVTQLSTVHAI